MNPIPAHRSTRRFWVAFATVFFMHFLLLVLAFYYAMSWSIITPSWLPLQTRMAVADAIFFVISIPLSLFKLALPITSESFILGWLLFAAVSVTWAFVIARLWCRERGPAPLMAGHRMLANLAVNADAPRRAFGRLARAGYLTR